MKQVAEIPRAEKWGGGKVVRLFVWLEKLVSVHRSI
jgi:hypothetical protein